MIPTNQAAILLWLSESHDGYVVMSPGVRFSKKNHDERVLPLVGLGLVECPEAFSFDANGNVQYGSIRVTPKGYDTLIEVLESKLQSPPRMRRPSGKPSLGPKELEW